MNPPAILRNFQPEVGIILGSGWGRLEERITSAFTVRYDSIYGLPVPKVPGHSGHFLGGFFGGCRLVAASGRVHLYEGWEASETTAHVRLLAACGIRMLIVCNAAGAVNAALEPGDLMMIVDHLNWTGRSPLTGTAQFLDMRDAYSPRLQELFRHHAHSRSLPLKSGVYACVPGPQYETPAEIRMLRVAGADAVGMSTALEVIQARALGIETAAFSAITNRAADVPGEPLTHEEVLKNAASATQRLALLLEETLTLGLNCPT